MEGLRRIAAQDLLISHILDRCHWVLSIAGKESGREDQLWVVGRPARRGILSSFAMWNISRLNLSK